MGFENKTGGMKISSRLLSLLCSAISEWCLIVLLFLIASLSHLATKLALSCKLPIPCLLCTRLDYIISNGRRGSYRNFLCHKHKLEISSLALCHNHKKLADAREMCDKCLISSIIQKKQKSKSCKGLEYDFEDMSNVPSAKKCSEGCAPMGNVCFCCNRSLKNNDLYAEEQLHSIKDVKPNRRKQHVPKSKPHKSESPEPNSLAHVGYRELKITSDSESEILLSDRDEVKERSLSGSTQLPTPESMPRDPTITISKEESCEKRLGSNPNVPEESFTGAENEHVDDGAQHDRSSKDSSIIPKIDLDDINQVQNSKESNGSSLSRSTKNASIETPSEPSISETSNFYVVSNTSSPKISRAFGPSNSLSYQVGNDLSATIRAHSERNDSLKHAFSNKGGIISPKLSELLSSKDFSRGQEELKARLSRKSSGKNLELPWNELVSSPKLQLQGDETRPSDASFSRGLLHNMSQRIGIERNYSSLEALEINIVNEIEGESPVDRLKRQVELDKKSMTALYKELEEERSASAIAANEAMAMINRLQEEKASMQMEALHYLRMMEEQSEYDQEAIQKMNDLLTEREKELLDLEAELDSYRKQFGEELAEEKVIEPLGVSKAQEHNNGNLTPRYMKTLSSSKSDKNNIYGSDVFEDPFYGFEEEKAQISECLNRLKERLHAISVSQKGDDVKKHGLAYPDSTKIQSFDGANGFSYGIDAKENEKSSSMHMPKGIHDTNEDFSTTNFSVQLKVEKDENIETELNMDGEERGYLFGIKGNRISLQDEVSSLSARMDALETDKKLLDVATNMLRNGTCGLQYVHEIACHLQELRRICVSQMEEIVA